MANILVLGGSGFIGRSLIKDLLSNPQNKIKIFDKFSSPFFAGESSVEFEAGDFDSSLDFDKLCSGIDIVYHLISTSVPGTAQQLSIELANNVQPSIKLFEAAARQGVKKIIFLSSGGTVYSDSSIDHHEDEVTSPINSYGMQKVLIENSLRFIAKSSNLDYRIIRLSNPFGPGQNPLGPVGLITKLIYQSIHEEPIDIYGDGSIIRDYIYIDDAIKAIITIANNQDYEATYNVGTGFGYSINEIVEMIGKISEHELKLQRKAGRAIDVRRSVLNIDKFKESSKDFKFTSVQEGIEKTYQFLLEN